jgi:uncharacterized protein YaiE (UPF0345 family)
MHFASHEVVIPATHWQEFENGESVEVTAPRDVTLQVGDTIWWAVAQFDGLCEVVQINHPATSVLVRNSVKP